MKWTIVFVIVGGIIYENAADLDFKPNQQWFNLMRKPTKNRQDNNNCPEKCRCGVPSTRTRIIGGVPATIYEVPWMTFMQTIEDNGTHVLSFACGGAMITDRHVLTAAHCIKGLAENATAILGIADFTSQDNMIWKDASEFIVHSGWDNKTMKDDIAIVKLAEPLAFSDDPGSEDYITPVCLPESGSFVGETVKVAGWGKTSGNGSASDKLLKVDLKIEDDRECLRRFGQKYYNSNKMMCAGKADGSIGTCQGDSGGSLFHKKADDTYQSIGITSYGKKWCKSFSAYTSVFEYIDWIRQNTADGCTCK